MMLPRHINLRLKVHKLPHQMQVDVLSQNGREMDIVMMGITIQVVIMMVEIAAQTKDLYTAEYVNARILTILQQLYPQQLFQDAVFTHFGKMMEIVMMKIILKNVIMMEEIAAPTLSRTIAHFVNAKTLNITTI